MPYIVPTIINRPEDLILAQLLFGGLIFIGLFIKILSTFIQTNSSLGQASITVWAYIIILFSLLGLVIIQITPNKEPLRQLYNIPYTVFVLAVIVLWIIILNINYTKEINKNTIPPTYSFWNKWSTFFIGIITILILIQMYGSTNSSEKNEYIKKTIEIIQNEKTTINVYLGFILFLNLIITGIQTTILSSFTVDS
jgi:hypothetical protein